MRSILYASAALAVACVWPGPSRSALTSAAAILVEATPFLLAGTVAARAARRTWLPYAGCGCGESSARSVPAAALTWIVMGPFVASARFCAAIAVQQTLLRLRRMPASCEHGAAFDVLAELERLLPGAIASATIAQAFERVDPTHLYAPMQAAIGAALGFASAPCAIGAVAFAAALRVHAPVAAVAFLCIAGIADVHTLFAHTGRTHRRPDALGYLLGAVALVTLARTHGGSLVHPAFTAALYACAAAFAILAIRFRSSCSRRARIAPALMLAGTLGAAAVPAYHSTETTLVQLFPGERVTFTGTLTSDGKHEGLVRYTITCCRADAAPVAVRLGRILSFRPGSWVRVDGIVIGASGDLALLPQCAVAISPPGDPFLYR